MGDPPAVAFLDVGASYRELQADLDAAVASTLAGGHYVLGPELSAFEAEFADYVEAAEAVGVGNGLDALTLALLALGIGRGDEVVVPSHTFVATWLAVSEVGATPVPVDPHPDTFTIEAAAVDAVLTSRTRAVLPVHLYGRPVELGPLKALCERHGLALVEDAAQAHGARYRGRRVGAHGHAVCWSFYPGKNLGAFGDGGAVTTDDPALARRLRRLRNYGSETKYRHEELGRNSRLDELQAAVLRVKLRHLDQWNDRRRAVASYYRERLAAVDALVLPTGPDTPGSEAVWHLFVVRSPHRERLAASLAELGVATLVHYPVPPHRQLPYAVDPSPPLPVADRLASEVLSLPVGPHLSAAQVDLVVSAVHHASGLPPSSP